MMFWGLRLLYGYRVRNHAVEVVLFHVLPVYRVPVDNIELIRKVLFKEALFGFWSLRELVSAFSTLRLGNRIFGPWVLIQKRNGWIRRILITPNDADAFIREVARGTPN
jgi:hypothetical protein